MKAEVYLHKLAGAATAVALMVGTLGPPPAHAQTAPQYNVLTIQTSNLNKTAKHADRTGPVALCVPNIHAAFGR